MSVSVQVDRECGRTNTVGERPAFLAMKTVPHVRRGRAADRDQSRRTGAAPDGRRTDAWDRPTLRGVLPPRDGRYRRKSAICLEKLGAPDTVRTCDLCFRKAIHSHIRRSGTTEYALVAELIRPQEPVPCVRRSVGRPMAKTLPIDTAAKRSKRPSRKNRTGMACPAGVAVR